MNENSGRLVDRLFGVAGRRGAGRRACVTRARMLAAVLPVAFGTLLALPLQTQAQTVTTFVSNLGNTDVSRSTFVGSAPWGQEFQTGTNADGYTLTEIVVQMRNGQVGSPAFALYTAKLDPATTTPVMVPDTKVVDLSGRVDSPGAQSFTPDSTTVLSASTSYIVQIETTSGSANLQLTSDDVNDPGSSPGWDITPDSLWTNRGSWGKVPDRIKIAVKGTLGGATTSQTPVTLVSNEQVGTASPASPTVTVRARAFTTGANPGGYGLTGAKVAFGWSHAQSASSAVLVRIFSVDAAGNPGVELGRLIGPEAISSGLNTFTAPPNTVLDPGTSYALVITGSPASGSRIISIPAGLSTTQAISTDPHSLPGWSMAPTGSVNNNRWVSTTFFPVFSLEGTVRDAETVTQVWSATMNIGATSDGTVDGYCNSPCFGDSLLESFGSLEDDSGFVGESYSVESIRFDTSFDPDRLVFTVVNPSFPKTFQANDDGLLLKIGITDYDLNDLRVVDAGHATKTRYEWETASSTVPSETRPWNDAGSSNASSTASSTATSTAAATAVIKLIRRAASTAATSTATSTDPSLAGCGSIWCATVTAGYHDDGSDYANDYYGYVAPGAGTIDRTEFTYDGVAYTVTVAGRREGGGADTYVIGIDPEPSFDFVLGVDGRTLQSTAASTSTATTTDNMSAGVVYAWPGGTGTAWDVGDTFDIGLSETAETMVSAMSEVTITALTTYPVLHGHSGDALEYQLERTDTDGALSVWVDLSSGSPEFVPDGDRRRKVDFVDGESTATLSIPAWQLVGIPALGEVIEGGAVTARLAEGSAYTVGTPGAAQQRVVVWVVGFDARNYEVDERDEKVAVSLTARYVGGGLPAPEFNSMHYLSISSAAIKVAGVETEATSPEDYAGVSVSRAFPEDSSGPDKGFSDVDGDGTYETTYTFDQGIVWDAEYEGPDGERFLIVLAITPGLASLTQFAWPDGRRCENLDTNNPDFPNNCLTIVTINDSPRTAIENVSIISAPAAAPDTYGAGERIRVAVQFARDVRVDVPTSTSTATVTMQVGTDDVMLPYAYQKAKNTVVFGPYEVQDGDMDDNGVDLHRGIHPLIRIIENKPSFEIVADGIAFRDGNGNEVFPYLQLPNAGVFAQHKVDGSLTPPPVLVSNTGLGHGALAEGVNAQGFHTGGSGAGGEIVTIHSVGILVEECSACPADPAQARVRVYGNGEDNRPAGEPLFALNAPSSVATSTVARFTAPEDAVLRANADYHLLFDDSTGGRFPWKLAATTGDTEDGEPGWTIADRRSRQVAGDPPWISSTNVLLFDIRGATSTVPNMVATGEVRILGGAREDVTMTVDTSDIADGNGMATAEFQYFWLTATTTADVPVRIDGETAEMYTPGAADVGRHIAVAAYFTDDAGYPESLTSDFTPQVASSTRPNLAPTGTPTIEAANTRVGDTLTADASSVMDEDGLTDVVFTYEWLDALTGEVLGTGPVYNPQPGDEGRTIMLRVSFTDNLGLPNTIDSVATMAVAAQPADGCRPDRIQLWAGTSASIVTVALNGDLVYCHNNEYRHVCDDAWDRKDANVACRQAGYHSAKSATDGSNFVTGDSPLTDFWLDELACTGAEATLGLCAHDGWGVHDCQFSERAGVRCQEAGSQTLSALSLTDTGGNAVVLSSVWADEFDPVVADYTARVASTTAAVVVAATSTDPAATVTINGTAATKATVSFAGADVLSVRVQVTAAGGAVMDYRIAVARGSATLRSVPSVTIANATSTEGSAVVFTVTLSATTTDAVSVDYATSVASGDTATLNNSAPGGVDFASSTDTLAIGAGQMTGTISVATLNDTTDEYDERFTMTLGAATGAQLGSPSSAKGTILDNDDAPRVNASSATVTEGATTTLAVVFELTQVSGKQVAFDYETEDDTAAAGQDYTSATGTVTFLPGRTEARDPIEIEILDDAEAEAQESFLVKGSNGVNVTIPSSLRNGVSQFIDDDGDGPPPPPPPPPQAPRVSFAAASYTATEGGATAMVRVNLDSAVGSVVDIPLIPDNRGGAVDGDYSGVPSSLRFGASQTTQSFTVRAVDDAHDDDGESVVIRFGSLPSTVEAGSRTETTVHLGDNDGLSVSFGKTFYKTREGGEPATVKVQLNGAPSSSVTIPLTRDNRNGTTNADYSGVPPSVTFGPSETVQTFAVTAQRDNDAEDAEEVRIGFGALPSNVGAGNPSTTSVALEDDLSVAFGAASYTAAEGGAGATVTVRLTRSWGAPFTLPLTVEWQGGASTSDYSGIPGSVTFRGDETTQTFTVTAVDDAVNDDGESVEIGFGWPRPQALWTGSPSTATVQLVDNDNAHPRGALRLVGGGGSYGRLQVYHDGQWGLVCDTNFDELGARVACRQLGFADGEEGYGGAGSGGLPFWLNGVECDGTESRLVNCPHWGLKEHSCGSFHIVGVECSRTPLSVTDARVAGTLLTLSYDAALDGGSVPSGRDFVVTAGALDGASAVTAVPVTAVAVDGDALSLTLARGVLPDERVRLSYLVAPMHPVQDTSGGPAAPLTDVAVRNETGPGAQTLDVARSLDAVVAGALQPPVVTQQDAAAPGGTLSLPAQAPLAGRAQPAPLAGRAQPAPLDLSPWLADAGASAPLGRLDLSSRALADLSALAALTQLRVLNLGDNALADLASLSGLTGLRVLDLSANALADVSPLAGLTGLERLDLSGNRIADVSALSGLTGLEVLLLDGNRIDDLAPLWTLQGLVHLGLSGNRVADVGLLAELGALQRLDLGGNRVADISPLGDLSGLVWLRLPGNPVSDAVPLGRLTHLRWLWLDDPVAGLEALMDTSILLIGTDPANGRFDARREPPPH